MVQTEYSLSWDFYKSNICSGFISLQQNGEFVDMTLAADGHFVKVHQALVSLASPYLKSLITTTPCQHPVIFLNNISHKTLTNLLEYIYTGEVLVTAENLMEFADAAKSLHVKGLENLTNIDTIVSNNSKQPDAENLGQITLPVKAKKIVINKPDMPTISVHKPLRQSLLKDDEDTHDYDDPLDNTELYSDDDGITERQNVARSNTKFEEASSKLQYSASIRGALQIILNRYIYNLSTSSHKGIRRWRCVDYRCHKCMAFVVTRDNVVLNRANPHNHPFHDKKILAKIEKNTIFAALEDAKLKSSVKEEDEHNDKSMQIDDVSGYSDVDDKNCGTMFG